MKRAVRVVVAVVGVAAAVAGCTGDPGPAAITSRPPTRATEPTVAPTVTGGVDLRPYLAEPCSVLTADQREAVGGLRQTFEGGDPDRGACTWESATAHATVFTYVAGDPLAEVYRQRNDENHTYFEPITVGGLPAVRTWVAPPPANGCDVYVGAGHGQGLRVESTGGDAAVDWCGHATAMAEAMIATARGQG